MSSPANAPTRETVDRASRPRRPCRPGPAAAARPPCGPGGAREPVPIGELVRDRHAPRLRARSARAPVQRDRGPPLRSTITTRGAAPRPRRPPPRSPATYGSDTRIDRDARRRRSTRCRTDRRARARRTATCSARNVDRAAAHDPDPTESSADEPLEHRRPPPASGRASLGMIDDRRERTVEVEEQRRRPGRSRERDNHCVDVEHDATLPAMECNESGSRRRLAVTDLKAARDTVDQAADALVALSHRIHAHPGAEVRRRRSRARGPRRCSPIAGSTVDAGICDLPTAFVVPGRRRSAPPRDLRGVRRAARHRSRVRSQHHRRDRGRRRRSRSRRSSTSSA